MQLDIVDLLLKFFWIRYVVAALLLFLGTGFAQAQKARPSPPQFGRAFKRTSPSGGKFVWIPGGTFKMGSPDTEFGRDSDETQHTVQLNPGFWILDHEVTQAEYQAVMGNNPSGFTGANLPVEMVTWADAVDFCKKLTDRDRKAGWILASQRYRLPTEAEWEYAARGKTTGSIYGAVDSVAWWDANSGFQTHPVRTKAPNAWGLYDMMGNVQEWCADWYGPYYPEALDGVLFEFNPKGPASGPGRVSRGGSWNTRQNSMRSASRNFYGGAHRFIDLGFRPVLSFD